MGLLAVIEFVCAAHPSPDGVGPMITLIDGAWALCAGHGADSHDWTRIEPTQRELIGDLTHLQTQQPVDRPDARPLPGARDVRSAAHVPGNPKGEPP